MNFRITVDGEHAARPRRRRRRLGPRRQRRRGARRRRLPRHPHDARRRRAPRAASRASNGDDRTRSSSSTATSSLGVPRPTASWPKSCRSCSARPRSTRESASRGCSQNRGQTGLLDEIALIHSDFAQRLYTVAVRRDRHDRTRRLCRLMRSPTTTWLRLRPAHHADRRARPAACRPANRSSRCSKPARDSARTSTHACCSSPSARCRTRRGGDGLSRRWPLDRVGLRPAARSDRRS